MKVREHPPCLKSSSRYEPGVPVQSRKFTRAWFREKMEGVDWWRDKRGERNVNRRATTLPLLSHFEKVFNNAVWFDSQKVVAKKMKKKKVCEPSRILKNDINFKTDHNFLKIPTHWQSIFHSPPFILCKRRMIPLCSPEKGDQVTPTPPQKKTSHPSLKR